MIDRRPPYVAMNKTVIPLAEGEPWPDSAFADERLIQAGGGHLDVVVGEGVLEFRLPWMTVFYAVSDEVRSEFGAPPFRALTLMGYEPVVADNGDSAT